MIGIIFPLAEELAPFLAENLVDPQPVDQGAFRFLECSFQNNPLVVLVSGMGKVSGAMAAQALIDEYRPDAIVLAGVAGGLAPKMQPGDVFLADEICQHDVYDAAKGHDWQRYSHRGQAIYVPDTNLYYLASNLTSSRKVFQGRLLTGDKAVATTKYANKLRLELNGGAVDMESAAVSQVAAANNVPLLVIRTISDSADENSSNDFKINFTFACGALNEYLTQFLGKLFL